MVPWFVITQWILQSCTTVNVAARRCRMVPPDRSAPRHITLVLAVLFGNTAINSAVLNGRMVIRPPISSVGLPPLNISIIQEDIVTDHSNPHEPVVKSATDARQGTTTGTVRWVLAISLFGAIIALVVAYWLVHGV